METYTFNIAKLRIGGWYERAENNDPANAAIIVVPMATGGTQAQGQDLDSLAAIEADANFAERTTGGWVRKELESVQLAAFPAPNDVNNRYDLQVPSIIFTAPAAANDIEGFILCYDSDTTTNPDSAIIPMTSHLNVVETDGNDVEIQIGDFIRGS